MNRLIERTIELINIPSESHAEARILSWIAERLPAGWIISHEPGEWVLATVGSGPSLILAGHVDTVPAQGNLPARLSDDVIVGLGASDMKGGLAVMLELAERYGGVPGERFANLAERSLGLLFFAREELPVGFSPIAQLLSESPVLSEAKLVVMLEPSDCFVEVGSLGNIIATASFSGLACHSARPWLGRSAIDEALATLSRIAALAPVVVDVGGHPFTEVVTVVGLHAGVADNIVPPLAEARINLRYAPGRDPASVESELRALLSEASTTEIVSHAPAALVPSNNPWMDALVRVSGHSPRPKLAWTAVAEFAAAGVDAVNFGPGSVAAAHQADEWVETAALRRCFQALCELIEGGA